MSKRRVVWIVVFVLTAVSVAGIIYGINAVQDITLNGAQVQERIDARLPLIGNGLIVKKINVYITDDSLVLVTDAEGKRLGQEFDISFRADGVPYYDSRKGEFYFRPQEIKITSLKIKDETVSKKVEKFIDKYVDSPKINAKKDILAADIEKWAHGLIEKTSVWALEQMPIYTLPDTLKGNAVRIMLKSVEITNDNITFHLSFWRLTKMVIAYAVLFLLAVAVAGVLIMNLNGEWRP